jgi:hypothetical protein
MAFIFFVFGDVSDVCGHYVLSGFRFGTSSVLGHRFDASHARNVPLVSLKPLSVSSELPFQIILLLV